LDISAFNAVVEAEGCVK